MNKLYQYILISFVLSAACVVGVSAADTEAPAQVYYPAETQQTFTGPEKYFTGDVFVRMLFPKNDHIAFSGAYVTFQPGARTAWHMHPAGQHMIVTDGVCLTGTRDGKILEFKEGETVWCPPDIDHWHGATPHRAVTHLVITGVKDGQNVIWKEKVTDEQYLGKATNKQEKTMDVNKYLDEKQQAMIPISAFAASGDLANLKIALNAGLDAGLTVNEIKEILVHLYAYAGFPRSLNALGTFFAVVNERKDKGITDELGKDATPIPAGTDILALGKKVQTELVGQPVTGPLFDFVPVINEYLQAHLFGDIFARDVLDHEERELVTLSALYNMDGVEPQFKAHVAISLNSGVSKEQIQALDVVFADKVGKAKYDLEFP